MAPIDIEDRFPAYFRARLTEPDEEFARAFESGRYRQDRGFIRQIGLRSMLASALLIAGQPDRDFVLR